jgi:hypothetical protein
VHGQLAVERGVFGTCRSRGIPRDRQIVRAVPGEERRRTPFTPSIPEHLLDRVVPDPWHLAAGDFLEEPVLHDLLARSCRGGVRMHMCGDARVRVH